MSEKYSTGELIDSLIGYVAGTPKGEIVRRLRNADALVVAWNEWKDNPIKGTATIVKAIADYEEE